MSGSTISNTVTLGIVLGTVTSGRTYASPLTITTTGAVKLSGTGDAIYGPGTHGWTVINQGSVVVGGATGVGVDLRDGGSIGNAGLIKAPTGVYIGGATGTVTNSGTVAGAGTGAAGVYLKSGGVVSNAGLITGGSGVLVANYYAGFSGASGTVANSGTILATGTHIGPHSGQPVQAGIDLDAGGIVINGVSGASTALIEGAIGVAMHYATSETVVNFGTIEGTTGAGVHLSSVGSVINGASDATGALIEGGIFFYVGGSVTNYGTVVGRIFGNFGGATAVMNAGTINGRIIFVDSGILDNLGTVVASSTLAGDFGVFLESGGTITNGASGSSGARIVGPENGSAIAADNGVVINFGLIEGVGTGGVGVYISGGTFTNFGTVAAGSLLNAVIVDGGTFNNQGVITGNAYGIALGQTVGLGFTQAQAGVVTTVGTVVGAIGIGAAPGITAGYTVSVGGTVMSTLGSAGTAVSLGGLSGRLIVNPGAAFTGVVDGGGGASVLEIAASPGSAASGLGAIRAQGAIGAQNPVANPPGSFANFSALKIDPSAMLDNVSGVLSVDTFVNDGFLDVSSTNKFAFGIVVADSATTGAIDLETGGTIDFLGPVGAQMLYFEPPGGYAIIRHPELFAGVLSGFTSAQDTIDLTGLVGGTIVGGGTLNGSDQLVVSNGTQSAVLQLDTNADYTAITWRTSADAVGGTDVAPVCFCRGTQILTDRGEVAVEALAVGDRVVTVSGGLQPIRWIGFGRDLVTRRNSLARPIVVRAGALADNVPRRDLYLTHGHALYLDGVLIPVENLVNHRSIAWDDTARVVEYYHIELDSHDVLFAEGAAAESYYDASNRALFQNTRPGSAAGAARPTFAPVLTGGEIVERIWAAFYERTGGQIERETTDDPDVHLLVDGERLDPTTRDGVYSFAVARPPAATLRLRSRSGVLSLLGIDRSDHRRLGVPITRIVLWHAGIATSFEYDAPQLREGGCHLAEDGYCWTDGELALPARFFTRLSGAFTLAVHTKRHYMRYPIAAPLAAAA